MNFYPHHIGDYITATVHLTWLEDCAYRRLLDTYYTREQCLPADVGQVCRLVRAATKDERKAVETVLHEFFKPSPSGWVHTRCEHEIEKARFAAERAKANGMRGGRPRKDKPKANPEITQPVISGLSGETQDEPNPKAPITNPNTNGSSLRSEPPPPKPEKAGKGYTEEFERVWLAYPSRKGQSKEDAFKAWSARLADGATVAEMTDGAKQYAAYCEANHTAPRFVKHAATFFGADRHYLNDWTLSPPRPVAGFTSTPNKHQGAAAAIFRTSQPAGDFIDV